MDKEGMKSFSKVQKWTRKEGRESSQAEVNPCAKRQCCNENIRRHLISVQEFGVHEFGLC